MRRSRTDLRLPSALVAAFHDAYSRTGAAAREMMARLLADEASRNETRGALFAGLTDPIPQIRGTCALLLLQSGEPAQPQLLRALLGTFASPDAETGRGARELVASLLADEASREQTSEVLACALNDDAPSVRRTCEELLQTLGRA